ncbi:biofilm protein TabA [Cohaesibacter sp. ES.047]|uniref:YhcH/YjgK/YiaL family protein n=1 Tax=Cohaesibacter sp. ES.047 TaxID=1798205 RepID=UPI000BC02B80|nr:YhcH/YjgK/YiaL family protein [Cohaesibacter sp. ES.047]SNY90735.1 biofilm protein TabA [Cohaesibacter sp. ES.047]
MLSANLNNLSIIPYLQPELAEIIGKVKALVESKPALGRHEIDGDKFFVNFVEDHTEPFADRRPEFHRNYLDIQVLAEGAEIIGWSHSPATRITEDLLKEKDVAFTKGSENEKLLTLAPMDFAIFYPGEVHRPLVATEEGPMKIFKFVAKIHRSLLEK